jgi:hypothetical protein
MRSRGMFGQEIKAAEALLLLSHNIHGRHSELAPGRIASLKPY